MDNVFITRASVYVFFRLVSMSGETSVRPYFLISFLVYFLGLVIITNT